MVTNNFDWMFKSVSGLFGRIFPLVEMGALSPEEARRVYPDAPVPPSDPSRGLIQTIEPSFEDGV